MNEEDVKQMIEEHFDRKSLSIRHDILKHANSMVTDTLMDKIMLMKD